MSLKEGHAILYLQQEVAVVAGGQPLQAGGRVQGVPDQDLVHLQL